MSTRRGIIAWFARNSVAANLLMWLLLIGGLVSAFTIQREIFPDIEQKLISVSVAYPGASPEEVEDGVVLRIEEAIEQISGIKQVTAIAEEGMASVTIEVQEAYDLQQVLDEVKLRVDAIVSFPETIEKPLVYELKFEKEVIWVQLMGDVEERALKELARQIRDEIVALPEVSTAEVFGARDYEIAIEVRESALLAYGVTFDEVATAVRNSSLDLPSGTIRASGGDILVRAKAQAYNAEAFGAIVVRTYPDGRELRVGDLAKVTDGFSEDFGYARFDGKPTVGVQIKAVGDEDAMRISAAVNRYVEQRRQTLPTSITLASWGDSTYYLKGRLDLMLNNMSFSALLVFMTLAAFLPLRLAFWVMVGLPVCFLGTLLLLPLFGVTINMISLFGFILVLGILVDDAIVIGESVATRVQRHGHSVDNVIRGAQRVATAATFGVLTTVCAFVPMLMVSGPFGIIWNTIGFVVVLCLLFSLVESKLILPAHLVHMKLTPDDPHSRNPVTRARLWCSDKLHYLIHDLYKPGLMRSLRHPWATICVFVALIIVTIGLVAGGKVRSVAFPDIPSDFIRAQVDMVEGAPQQSTAEALDTLIEALYRMDDQLYSETGERVVKHAIAFDRSNTSGLVWVELSKGETRTIDGEQLSRLWREAVPPIAGVRSLSFDGSTAAGPGSDVSFILRGSDLATLTAAAAAVKQVMAEYQGLFDINDDLAFGKEELTIRLKPGAEALGITLADVARQVRQGFYGAEAQRIQRSREEIKVMVRYPVDERISVGYLEQMRIRTTDGRQLPFSAVASLERGRGYAAITRVDGQRSVTVSASADKSRVEPGKVVADLTERLPQLLARFPGVVADKEGAAKEESAAYGELLIGAVLALIGIYGLMAVPLRSYSQPLIIMAVIPFGIIGAVIGHWLLGLPVSVLSLCGIIALSGVVVNDSLVMVEFVNQSRYRGLSLGLAVVEAGTQRFRAILLTSLTTFFGLIPIILEKSLQAQIVIPMAVSLAFGILFSTVITLYLVPAIYVAGAGCKRWLFSAEEGHPSASCGRQ